MEESKLQETVQEQKEEQKKKKKKKKKGRGRPKKEEVKPEETEEVETEEEFPDIVIPVELLIAPLDGMFNKMAEKRGDHWRLDDNEKIPLSGSVEIAGKHYLPRLFKDYPAIAPLVLNLTLITMKRILIDITIKKAAEEDDQKNGEKKRDSDDIREKRERENIPSTKLSDKPVEGAA